MLSKTRFTQWSLLTSRYLSTKPSPLPQGDEKIQYRTMSPTMAQSFGKKFSDQEIERYIDPKGFTNEINMEEYEEVKSDSKVEEKKEGDDYKNQLNYKYKEFGFKHKGPEPTRHGDWEIKGRCTDF
mmetsp:Transcript_15180/g.13310  ORF Transcript_15180/g.13310 Transcript_15180/m.13310 type:complete len:126 (+) Transcript_15180:24-401(+)